MLIDKYLKKKLKFWFELFQVFAVFWKLNSKLKRLNFEIQTLDHPGDILTALVTAKL